MASELEANGIESGRHSIEQLVEPLARVYAASYRPVVLTGAGISTESGIPDYRSPNGIWARHTPILYADFVGKPEVRRRYWARSLNGYPRFRDARPNSGHHALAALEQAGRLHFLITQNVDRLHLKAGSRRVLELHGENSNVRCIECNYREPRTQTQARLEWENRDLRLPADEEGDAEAVRVPECPRCGGLIKPDVVFFGESLAPGVGKQALDLMAEADALLVVGSSLSVMSGYRLARAAHDAGKPLLILNIGPTRADSLAGIKVEAPAGEALSALAGMVLSR